MSEPPVPQRDEALKSKIAETWGQPYDAMAEEKLIVLSANNEHILWEFAYSGDTRPVCSSLARGPHDRLEWVVVRGALGLLFGFGLGEGGDVF